MEGKTGSTGGLASEQAKRRCQVWEGKVGCSLRSFVVPSS